MLICCPFPEGNTKVMLDKDAPALQNSYLLLGHIGIRGKITPEITGGAFCTRLKGAQSAAIDFRYEHNPKST